VGGILGQEDQLGAGPSNGLAYRLGLVGAEVVEDDDIAWLEGGDEHLPDVGQEPRAIDRPVEQAGGLDGVLAQRSQERRGLPMTVWDLGKEPLPARRPAVRARHVGLGPGLIDEDQARWIDQALTLAQPSARSACFRAVP